MAQVARQAQLQRSGAPLRVRRRVRLACTSCRTQSRAYFLVPLLYCIIINDIRLEEPASLITLDTMVVAPTTGMWLGLQFVSIRAAPHPSWCIHRPMLHLVRPCHRRSAMPCTSKYLSASWPAFKRDCTVDESCCYDIEFLEWMAQVATPEYSPRDHTPPSNLIKSKVFYSLILTRQIPQQ